MSAAICGSDAMLSLNACAEATMRIPYRPIPRPQAMAMPARSASWRLNGPAIPAGSDGSRSQPTFATPPRSRRSNASTPMASRTTSTAARNATDAQSDTPAIGRWPAVQAKNDSGVSASITGDRLA